MPKPQRQNIDKFERTEMTFVAMLAKWINELIKGENLSFGKAEVEIRKPGDAKRADILIYSSESTSAVCVIECKRPHENVLSSSVLEQSFGYATQFQIPYFCTCNGASLALLETKATMGEQGKTLTAGLLEVFHLAHNIGVCQVFCVISRKLIEETVQQTRWKSSLKQLSSYEWAWSISS